jgi:hypothetical protein
VEWVLYAQNQYNNRDVYTGPAPGTDGFLVASRAAIAAAGKAVATVDNLAGGAAATRWGPVITAAAANRKHMSLGHGNVSLALATTNDTLQDNNANVGIAGAAVGAINDVEWFHCCTGARFRVQEPDGMGGMRPFRNQMLRSYWRAMPAAVANVSGYDQMVAASNTAGATPAKLWLVKGGNKYTATGAN